MIYSVYHPVGGAMNHDCTPAQYMYERIYSFEADSLQEAFRLSQNDFNEEYAALGYRSTSVGDIIQSQTDWENNECQLVKGTGFQTLPDTWLRFIDWGIVHPRAQKMLG